MYTIPIIRPQGQYLSRDQDAVYDIADKRWGGISLAPPLLITQIMGELQTAPTMPQEGRLAAIARAGDIFAEETLEGETPEIYCQRYAQISGVPIVVAQRSLEAMRRTMQEMTTEIALQQPQGATTNLKHLCLVDTPAVWLPRGKTLAVIASGNHPMTHTGWLQALALGYHIAVRPSRRDPFTPLRLIRSLLAAGLEPGHTAFLPSLHIGVERMIETANLSIIYGSANTVSRYVGKANILVRGPGHSKLFIERRSSLSDTDLLDLLLDAVASDGGVRCTNASALLIGEDTSLVAEAVAERLSRLAVLTATDPAASLPIMPLKQATNMRKMLEAHLGEAVDLNLRYTSDGPIVDLGDGTAVLRPAVILCQTSENPAFGMEFPFPCVWVAPWIAQDGVKPLRNSLAVTMITEDETLVRDALYEPSIRKVHWGPIPPYISATGIPHDGYIGHFLMEAKGLMKSKGDMYDDTR